MRLAGHIAVLDLGPGGAGTALVVRALCAANPVAAVIRCDGATDGFGAGTTLGTPTHLSRFTVVDPLALADRAGHLAGLGVPDPFGLLTVDARAPLATPWHHAASRSRAGPGPCAVDETLGYARSHPDAPRAADLADPLLLRRRLAAVRARLTDDVGPLDAPPLDDVADAFRAFGDAVAVVRGTSFRRWLLGSGVCVFEGARCAGSSPGAFARAAALCGGARPLRLGVVCPYSLGSHPGRVDAVALRYAVEVVGGVDGLAVVDLDDAPALGVSALGVPVLLRLRSGRPAPALTRWGTGTPGR